MGAITGGSKCRWGIWKQDTGGGYKARFTERAFQRTVPPPVAETRPHPHATCHQPQGLGRASQTSAPRPPRRFRRYVTLDCTQPFAQDCAASFDPRDTSLDSVVESLRDGVRWDAVSPAQRDTLREFVLSRADRLQPMVAPPPRPLSCSRAMPLHNTPVLTQPLRHPILKGGGVIGGGGRVK